MALTVTFWGVRGTIPCPSASHLEYGGNTSCVEVTAGDQKIILDCGTGLRMLGKRYLEEPPQRATILLSHAHLDHIAGFPFFQPAFCPGFSFHIVAGRYNGNPDIRTVLAGLMEPPLFPVPLRTMRANLTFEDFRPGAVLHLDGGLTIRTAPLRHPDGASGYRIDYDGRSLAYVTDTEHVPGELDANILGLIEGADLVIYDSTYTEAEFVTKIGWGHSTWSQGVKLCQAAGARRLALFHHEPDHDDQFMAALEQDARSEWSPVFAAREGTTLEIA